MVGAGASSAMKLPNTPSLINEVLRFSSTSAGKWLADDGLRLRLSQAFEFFYPDAKNAYLQVVPHKVV